MNSRERNDYIIAIVASIIFHILLLIIVLPEGFLYGKPEGNDTIMAELVEFSSTLSNLPSNDSAQIVEKVVSKPTGDSEEKQQSNKSNDTEVPIPIKPNNESRDVTKVESKEAKPDLKPTNTDNKDVANAPTQPSAPSVPKNLGSGAGMVTKGLTNQKYPYPKNAMNRDKEGEVLLKVQVKANGKVEKIELLKSTDDREMERAARSYILNDWIFIAFDQDYYIDLVVKFKIENERYFVRIEPIKSETRP